MSREHAAWRNWVGAPLACALAFGLGVGLRHTMPVTPVLAYADQAMPSITVDRQAVSGGEWGLVKIDGSTVIRLRTWAGQTSPYQRAQTVAGRLQTAVQDGAGSAQVRWETRDYEAVVLMGNDLVATADRGEADAQNMSPDQLAERWSNDVAEALRTYGDHWTRPTIIAERRSADGQEYGMVRIGDTTGMEIRTWSGGYSPYERAQMVAQRINAELDRGLSPTSINSGRVQGEWAVTAGSTDLITANQEEASLRQLTPQRLADSWAYGLSQALYGVAPTSGGEGETWSPSERYDKKIVPILSILNGVRLGAAQVQGPYTAVHDTGAVGQAELSFQKIVKINVYVPIRTASLSSLSRVQGVGVTGVADIGLVR